MRVTVGAKSDIGRVRTRNEDSYLLEEPIFVVADGMGGHIAGDVASSTAVQTIADRLPSASAADPETLAQLVRDANSAIWSKAQADSSLSGMGTTCTLVFFDESRAHIAHVGDSRAYRLRDGALEQLTEDHTLVARMVKEGKLRPEDAERHPHRSVITRTLGVDSEVRVDLTTIELLEGDRLLLSSDGLTSMLDEEDITEVVAGESDPSVAAALLVELANEAGGEDNITVVILDVAEEGASGAGATSAARAEPPPPPGRARRDTAPDPVSGDGSVVPPRRGRWLRLLVPLVVLIAVVAGGFVAARYALDRSWFVGVDESDRVTIFSGIPEEIAGLDLREEQEVTSTTLDDLPEFLRPNVKEGIKVSSLSEAHEKVADLNDRAQEFSPEVNRQRPENS
ncbi:hypothetical protein BH24ACT26_BH24ACT26_17860 [soil metagenome]